MHHLWAQGKQKCRRWTGACSDITVVSMEKNLYHPLFRCLGLVELLAWVYALRPYSRLKIDMTGKLVFG